MKIRSSVGLALAAAALIVLPAANASAALIETSACDHTSLSQPFARWGDDAFYKLVPGADFEGSLEGWSLSGGASRTAGSETFALTGAMGAYALRLPAGASATSPTTCVDTNSRTYRFVSRSSGGVLGVWPLLKVELIYPGLSPLPLGTAAPSSSWAPSRVLRTGAVVATLLNGGVTDLALRFTSLSGTWTIDDVFVDPAQRG